MAIIRNLFWVAIGMGVGRAATFLTAILLARHLGPDGFGEFSLFYTVMLLVWHISGALDFAYVRFAVANRLDPSRIRDTASEVKNSELEASGDRDFLRAALILKAAFCMLCLACAYPTGIAISQWGFGKPDATMLVTWGIVSGGFLSFMSSAAGAYQAEERFLQFSVLNTIFSLISMGAVGLALLSYPVVSPLGAVGIHVAASFVTGAAALIWLFLNVRPLFPIRTHIIRTMLRFGQWLFGAFLAFVISQRIDMLVLTCVVPFDELGVYSAAERIALIGTVLTTGAGYILLPMSSRLQRPDALRTLNQQKEIRQYLRSTMIVCIALAICIGILILISPALITILFGEMYHEGTDETRVLLLGYLFASFYGPLSFIFYGLDRPQKLFLMNLIKLLVGGGVVLLLSLCLKMGTMGAAWGMTAGHLASLVYVTAILRPLWRSGD